VKAISKDINVNFGLEKCARIFLKRGRVQSKMHIGSTFEKDIKELDPRIACKYLAIEGSHDTKNNIQANGSLAVPVLRLGFGIINWC
jgi:hypothetical protein